MLTSPERYSTSCNGQACQTKSVRVLEVRPGINSRAFKGLLSDSNLHSGLRERALHDFHPRGEMSSVTLGVRRETPRPTNNLSLRLVLLVQSLVAGRALRYAGKGWAGW